MPLEPRHKADCGVLGNERAGADAETLAPAISSSGDGQCLVIVDHLPQPA